MNLLRIAARVVGRIAQEECDEVTTAQQEQIGYIKKTPGKGYCVKSEKNSDWSGGCYPSKGEAKERLKQVEKFKHMKNGSAGYGSCPTCECPGVSRCRCRLADTRCANGHEWHHFRNEIHLGPLIIPTIPITPDASL